MGVGEVEDKTSSRWVRETEQSEDSLRTAETSFVVDNEAPPVGVSVRLRGVGQR